MTITNISLNHFAQMLFKPFLEQAEVTEIAINRPGEVWYERQGAWQKNDNPEITNKQAGETKSPVCSMRFAAKNGAEPPKIAILKLCPRESPEQRTWVGISSVSVVGMVPKNKPISTAKKACTAHKVK